MQKRLQNDRNRSRHSCHIWKEHMKTRREISECDAVSLTDFGLILTLRTDYIFSVLEHSFLRDKGILLMFAHLSIYSECLFMKNR